MEDTLHQRLIGQEEAVTAVSRAAIRRVGLKNPNRPIASITGPTGVGREQTRRVGCYFFGSEEAMIRLICRNSWNTTLSLSYGSPPGYVV